MANIIELGDRAAVRYYEFYQPYVQICREDGKDRGLSISARFYDGTLWFARYSRDWGSEKKSEKMTVIKTSVSKITVVASRYGGKKGISEMTNDVMEMCSAHMDPETKIVPYDSDGSIVIHFKNHSTYSVEAAEDLSYEPDITVEAWQITKDDIEAIGIINSISIMLDRVAVRYHPRKSAGGELRLDAPAMGAYGKPILQLAMDICESIGGNVALGGYFGIAIMLGESFTLTGRPTDRTRPLIVGDSKFKLKRQRLF